MDIKNYLHLRARILPAEVPALLDAWSKVGKVKNVNVDFVSPKGDIMKMVGNPKVDDANPGTNFLHVYAIIELPEGISASLYSPGWEDLKYGNFPFFKGL
jgi:hypothetical protein